MGYYVNPQSGNKEDWLELNGEVIDPNEAQAVLAAGKCLPVCLVNNGPFTAAGIGYDSREVDAFLAPDRRPRVWFSVPKVLLEPFMT